VLQNSFLLHLLFGVYYIGLALAVKVEMKSSGAMVIMAFSITAPLFIYTLLQPQREKKSRKSDEKLFFLF